ncbi:flagellar basal body rod protein FlgF [Thiorhodovibrio frisius]|uniref:Flagellar basal-body rod protein FlgF n=1 Tax=Thiorhodovibrio frisius TaxID=631362 RepID=H8YZP6_9GAMM|nr:flagellar basal body rod protein FlgF [Thiorhodovibrio frisius]EIC22173.1 flagellar hook-basal body protein [Thiorhodovibrio frisius]WPL24467.1 Putative proximal rod protein [Thiorhodovibrio frisius]
MDRMLYVAMTGAKQTMYAQAVNNNNLANANTHGFRQSLAYAYTEPLRGPVYDSRDYVQVADEVIDFCKGAMQATGRDLDIAIQGDGLLAVQAEDGTEGYTRAGDLHIDAQGIMRLGNGLTVLGDGGPISIPPAESILIGADGTVTIRPLGGAPQGLAAIERLRLVNPPTQDLIRSEDGLFRRRDGDPAPADANVRVASGMLETSNVNTVGALTRMMELTRHYETQVKMMSTADNLGKTNNRLLGIS